MGVRYLLGLGTALVAAGISLLYVSFTRLFAVLHGLDEVFVLVGWAAGGVASGALLAHRFGWQPTRRPLIAALGAGAAAGLTVVAAVGVVWLAPLNLAALNAGLAFLAFAAAGMALAAPFGGARPPAGALGAAQAAGAGLAFAGSAALLDGMAPPLGALAAAALCAGGGMLLLPPALRGAGRPKTAGAGISWAVTGLGIATGLLALPLGLSGWWLELDPARVNSPKSLFVSVQDPELREVVVHSEWDSYARTDVTEPATTDELKWIYADGVAAGIIYRAGTAGRGVDALRADTGNLPYLLPGSREKVLIVGAGAAQEVLSAVIAGAGEIVATEGGGALLRGEGRFRSYSGDVFGHPAVRVVNQDGRAFLRASGEQFDLIFLSLATPGVAQPGGAASGSYLHTVEAFDDYLQALRQDGRLAIKLRDEQELTRAFNTAMQASMRRGATPLQAIRRLVAVNNASVAERSGRSVALPLLMVRKTPYGEDEARAAFQLLGQTPFQPLFWPHLESLSPLAAFAAEGLGPAAVEAQAPYQVRPATDASPFFFRAAKGLPWSLLISPAVLLLLSGGLALAARRPSADALDPDLDAPEGVAEGVVAFLEDDVPWRFIAFVAAVGVGLGLFLYPLLAYRLPFMIGHPTLGVPVALGAASLATAAGSLLALGVRPGQLRPAMGWAALGAALLAVAMTELLPMVDEALRGQGVMVRALVAAGLLAPVGVCAGVLFPAAAEGLAAAGRGAWTSLLWGVAALAATVGTFLALALGVAMSFTSATLLGAACLLAAFLMAGLRWLAAGDERDDGRGASGGQLGTEQRPDDLAPFQRPAQAVGREV